MNTRTRSGLTVAADDAGGGRPVVLLHAFPLARTMWRPQAEALRSEYRVLTPDLRGFGGTAGFTETPSVEQMADDIADWLKALRLSEPVALVGLSMGGYVALAFARRHPGWLAALVLADTKAEPDDETGRANRDKLIEFMSDHSAADLMEVQIPKVLSDTTRAERPEVVEEVRQIAAAQTPAGIIAALQALRDRPDAGPELAEIDVPTLVLVGAEDAVTPPAAAEALAGRIRGAQLETIPGAGHLSNLEQPDVFNAALRKFLDALDERR